jgi:hypothetical protein
MFFKVDYQGWVKIVHQMAFKYIIRSVKSIIIMLDTNRASMRSERFHSSRQFGAIRKMGSFSRP